MKRFECVGWSLKTSICMCWESLNTSICLLTHQAILICLVGEVCFAISARSPCTTCTNKLCAVCKHPLALHLLVTQCLRASQPASPNSMKLC